MSRVSSAEVGAIADGVDSYRARVAGLAELLVGTTEEDLLKMLYEVERSLVNANRLLRRSRDLAT